MQPRSFRSRAINIVNRKNIVPFENRLLVLNHRAEPARRLHHFMNFYFSVLVRIHKVKQRLIHMQIGHRTTQYRPIFLVKFAKMLEIFTTGDFHSYHSTKRAIIPFVRFFIHIIRLIYVDV